MFVIAPLHNFNSLRESLISCFAAYHSRSCECDLLLSCVCVYLIVFSDCGRCMVIVDLFGVEHDGVTIGHMCMVV